MNVLLTVDAASRLLRCRSLFARSDQSARELRRLVSGELPKSTEVAGIRYFLDASGLFLFSERDPVRDILRFDCSVWDGVADCEVTQFVDRVLRAFITRVRGTLPPRMWRAWHSGSYYSVFASSQIGPESARICFEISDGVIQLFGILPVDRSFGLERSFSDHADGWPKELDCRGLAQEAFAASSKMKTSVATYRPIHDHVLGDDFKATVGRTIARGLDYTGWYPSALSSGQNQFVSTQVDGPVRIHGPAGSGKTLSMAIKAIHEAERAQDSNQRCRILFVSHSNDLRDSVFSALDVLDSKTEYYFHHADPGKDPVTIEVLTLLDWCRAFLGGELPEGQLLEDDASEAKEYQQNLICDALDETMKGSWLVHEEHLSDEFKRLLGSSPRDLSFVTLLQHEIACVMKGNRISRFRKDDYMSLERPEYSLPLSTQADRHLVFDIFAEYESSLEEFGVFDTDDVVADVLSRLESPLWTRKRQRDGFDIIFVDEAHIFNDNERALLHYLTRDPDSLPRIVLALDILQAIGDNGLRRDGSGRLVTPSLSIAGASARDYEALTEGTEVDLYTVYRSPEPVLKLAASVVAQGPAVFDLQLGSTEIDNDARLRDAGSRLPTAETPTIRFISFSEFPAAAFEIAEKWKREYGWKRSEVVIVALTSESLEQMAETLEKKAIRARVLDRRGDLAALASAERSGTFVVSRPEYLGGLQFKGVVLIDVSEGHYPNYGSGARAATLHRAISEMYLTITRSQSRVAILIREGCSPSSILNPAIQKGIVRVTS